MAGTLLVCLVRVIALSAVALWQHKKDTNKQDTNSQLTTCAGWCVCSVVTYL